MDRTKLRSIVFGVGIAAALLSLCAVVGSFLRHVDTPDYLKQADEAVPWIRVGFGSALVAFVLGFFGRRFWRPTAVVLAFLLMAWWLLIAGSTF